MRALVVGAVEGTRVAVETIAGHRDWSVAGVLTLPSELGSRHSDFVNLGGDAERVGARLIHAANSNSDDACSAVAALAPDCTLVIGWSQICGTAFREAAGQKVIGYHPAALPRLRGRAAIPWTILLDEKITASTLFWLDDGVDSGDIVAQKFFHVAPRETAASLYSKHMVALRDVLETALPLIASGADLGQRQDDTFATYATKRTPADGAIGWTGPARDVDRLVRAVGRPYPGAFTEYRDGRIIVWAAEPEEGVAHHAMPGQIVGRGDAHFSVMCGDGGLLRITDFELAGLDRMPLLHARLGDKG